MIGKKRSDEEAFHYFRMREMVPNDHILKRIDKRVDFSFIRDRVRHLYSRTGRPSVDPEVMVRMLLVGYLFGITSERRLCEEVGMHIGYRWFVGLTMGDSTPDHTTFSKNRHGRFQGSGLWEEIFDEVVRRCIAAGLARGEHLSADGTLVAADASLESLEPLMAPREYLRKVTAANPVAASPRDAPPGEEAGKSVNETHRSRTDPDARVARKGNIPAKLCHQVGYVMDNASRVIVDVSVAAPGARSEMAQALAGLDRAAWRFRLPVETLGADGNYAAGDFLADLFARGVTPHVPVRDMRGHNTQGIYPLERFQYDPSRDVFLCPRGNILKYARDHKRQRVYRASQRGCRHCPVKSECTRDGSRTVRIHIYNEALEKAREQMQSGEYRRSQKHRKRIEALFGEAKVQMGLRRMKFRGRGTVAEQAFLTATAQNIKRLVLFMERRAPRPAEALRGIVGRAKNAVLEAFARITAAVSPVRESCSIIPHGACWPGLVPIFMD
jgi:transposase